MKKNLTSVVILVILAGLAVLVWIARIRSGKDRDYSPPDAQDHTYVPTPGATTNFVQSVVQSPFTLRARDMTPEQRAELARKFEEKFKPALEHWCSAYAGRVPFKPEDVTLDQFHSRLGSSAYTFMVGRNTRTFVENGNGEAKVDYLMAEGAPKALNSLPPPGTVPDLSVPVNRQQVLDMAQADTGTQYKPEQVVIKPTGAACSIMGGAFVTVDQHSLNGGEATDMRHPGIELVFGPDGKLLEYEGRPFYQKE
jgi:hypothetical protein